MPIVIKGGASRLQVLQVAAYSTVAATASRIFMPSISRAGDQPWSPIR
jgi:hypothetical protein